MPQLKNYTPFRNFRYYSLDNEAKQFGIVIAKATYRLHNDGTLTLAEEQLPLVFTDECHGEVNETSIRHPSDLVPVKPLAEVIVNAVAHAPNGEPLPSWNAGITVEGRFHLEKGLRVTGERFWRPRWNRELDEDEAKQWREHRDDFEAWELDEPTPATTVPIRWENAFGGVLDKGEDDEGNPILETNEHNPLGVGWIDEEATDHTQPVPAPRIEDIEKPVSEPYETLTPEGLGPIPPAWLPRRPLGGTYDQNWIDNVWPNWPADYDFAYHLSAHPALRWPVFFTGRERIWLRNLLPGGGEVQIQLPGIGVEAKMMRFDGIEEARRMNLDTVFLDIASDNEEERFVCLVWRTRFEPDTYRRVSLRQVEAEPIE